MARAPLDPSKLVPETIDGIPGDIPVITYTEKVLEAKEKVLRKYIEENYAKLQSVEKELAALTLEVKLTSGSKKAALEHLRRKIEQSSEKIKAARSKEEAAKKAWEGAAKAVADEEVVKASLCSDLKTMVQESAMQQYQRLEELTRKLDALNPDLAGGVYEVLEGLRAKIAPHGLPVLADANPGQTQSANEQAQPEAVSQEGAKEGNPGSESQNISAAAQPEGQVSEKKPAAAHVPLKGRGRGRGRGRGGGSLVLKPGNPGSQWTGAGFNVDDVAE